MRDVFAARTRILIIFLQLILSAFAEDAATDFQDENERSLQETEGPVTLVQCVDSLPVATEYAWDQERIRNLSQYLNEIDQISKNSARSLCLTDQEMYRIMPDIPIGTQPYKLLREKADLIAYFMPKVPRNRNAANEAQNHYITLQSLLKEPQIENLRLVEVSTSGASLHQIRLYKREHQKDKHLTVSHYDAFEPKLSKLPWFFIPGYVLRDPESIDSMRFDSVNHLGQHSVKENTGLSGITGFWTWPYFRCNNNNAGQSGASTPGAPATPGKWFISYTVAFEFYTNFHGLLSFDVDLTPFQINQCDAPGDHNHTAGGGPIDWNEQMPLFAFHGTHKCDPSTTKCVMQPSLRETGWLKGNYRCVCEPGHHAFRKEWNNTISGYRLESKWCASSARGLDGQGNETESSVFQDLASCRLCPPGCPDCVEKKSCMASTSFPFRLAILCVSIVCAVATAAMIIVVYKWRRKPAFMKSSPIFLCITLIGCIVMYSEMTVLFPMLSIPFCVAVKWTRHLGFCITYTALYMKLCRVYLTFRVKSAHKIKLTEKHLLHWMSPILVIMLLYLFAWTISDPPDVEVMKTTDGKRFYQCVYNWWDHAIAIGEIIFLAYGVWICWRIRENPDAQFISYSIYNIALVNVVMVTLHLLIVPKAGPDMKYLLAFVRVQLSTTITIGLVLGSKLYRTFRGETPGGKEIANSANGFGHDTLDLDEENIQLKEELQKMATQIERLKSYAMCKNNPHLKNTTLSSAKMDYGRLDSFTTL